MNENYIDPEKNNLPLFKINRKYQCSCLRFWQTCKKTIEDFAPRFRKTIELCILIMHVITSSMSEFLYNFASVSVLLKKKETVTLI